MEKMIRSLLTLMKVLLKVMHSPENLYVKKEVMLENML